MLLEDVLCARFSSFASLSAQLTYPARRRAAIFFEKYFRSDLRISLGASAGESSLCPVRSGCAVVQPLCEIQGLRGHPACSIFLAALGQLQGQT